MVKTRLQVSGDGSAGTRNYKALGLSGTITTILKEEGASAFWNGISAAWLREASYTSLRLGMYAPIKEVMGVNNDSNFFLKFAAGSAAGALGSAAGNPFDVLKTRMMANGAKDGPNIVQTATVLYEKQGQTNPHAIIFKSPSQLMISVYVSINRPERLLPRPGREHHARDGAQRHADELLRPDQGPHREDWRRAQRYILNPLVFSSYTRPHFISRKL